MIVAEIIAGKKKTKVFKGDLFTDDAVSCLVSTMLNPWMDTEDKYTIERDDENNIWVCKRKVVAYSSVSSSLYGYGETPRDAFDDCAALFTNLHERYKLHKNKT